MWEGGAVGNQLRGLSNLTYVPKPIVCHKSGMEQDFRYRGKTYTQQDIAFVRRIIAENPNDSRWVLSRKLCLAWGWVQKNGALCDQICRSFMLELERAGLIQLPPLKRHPHTPLANRRKRPTVEIDQTPIEAPLAEIKPVKFCEVRRGEHEKLCDSLIEQYHYLGYCQPVGEHLKYRIYAGEKPIACMTWSSAPRHIGCRDRFFRLLRQSSNCSRTSSIEGGCCC